MIMHKILKVDSDRWLRDPPVYLRVSSLGLEPAVKAT